MGGSWVPPCPLPQVRHHNLRHLPLPLLQVQEARAVADLVLSTPATGDHEVALMTLSAVALEDLGKNVRRSFPACAFTKKTKKTKTKKERKKERKKSGDQLAHTSSSP